MIVADRSRGGAPRGSRPPSWRSSSRFSSPSRSGALWRPRPAQPRRPVWRSPRATTATHASRSSGGFEPSPARLRRMPCSPRSRSRKATWGRSPTSQPGPARWGCPLASSSGCTRSPCADRPVRRGRADSRAAVRIPDLARPGRRRGARPALLDDLQTGPGRAGHPPLDPRRPLGCTPVPVADRV